MSTTPEGRVKKAVKLVVQRLGYWMYMPVQNGMGRSGIPDFIGCKPTLVTQEMVGTVVGIFFAVETKALGKAGDTTFNQERELAGIRAAGGIALVVDDVEQLTNVFTCK